MPDLAEQDDRRALAAPAARARLLPAPIATRAPQVLVVTGPSGVGKGTLIRSVMERFPGLEFSVSATTREPRPGEVDGRDYHFLTNEEFDRKLEAGEFLEHAEYAGNRYGTLRSELDRLAEMSSADDDQIRGLVLEIELQGARQVREALPEAVQIFVEPPSLDALRTRLVGRGAESPEQIERRLGVAERELAAKDEFHHRVVNDRLEHAVDELADLVATIWDQRNRGED